jgi:hypothetical protein
MARRPFVGSPGQPSLVVVLGELATLWRQMTIMTIPLQFTGNSKVTDGKSNAARVRAQKD